MQPPHNIYFSRLLQNSTLSYPVEVVVANVIVLIAMVGVVKLILSYNRPMVYSKSLLHVVDRFM